MTHVVLSLGSNINREYNIQCAVRGIRDHFGSLNISPTYETTSVGFKGEAFLNLVVGFYSSQDLLQIRHRIRELEISAGRTRGRKSFNSRVLDIDMILYGTHDLTPDFNIPRDEIEKYAYVLKPLSDLYPDHVHPITGIAFQDMWQKFDLGDQRLCKFEIHYPLNQGTSD